MRKIINNFIPFILCFSIVFGYFIQVQASPSFTLYYNGSVVKDGIIHYQNNDVVIGIKGSEANFTVYYEGSAVATT